MLVKSSARNDTERSLTVELTTPSPGPFDAESPYASNTVADDEGEAARMQAQAWRHVAQLLAQAVRVWSYRCAA